MIKNTIKKSLLTVVLFILSSNVWSQNQNVGLVIHYTDASNACESHALDCDSDSAGASLFYRWNTESNLYFQAAYHYLGEVKATYPSLYDTTLTADYQGEIQGGSLSLGYRLPLLDPLYLTGDVGALAWHIDVEGDEPDRQINRSEKGISPTAAIGLEWDITSSLATSLNYRYTHSISEKYTGGSNLNTIGLGLSLRFGGEDLSPPQNQANETLVVQLQPQSAPQIIKEYVLKFSDKDGLVLFKTDSSQLMAKMERSLMPMLQRLNTYDQAKLVIESHTDDVGSHEYNQALSERRGQAVSDFFTRNGIAAERIEVRAYGETRPLVNDNTAESRSINRRVALFSPAFELEDD